ncbi:hypothetical protein [Asticcacaulis solisilvae]|uniref:hypothetical protein n=1 Tax=Asticcacaulis solisilvae TaxID=1217274 RepID=UPI003FD82462
MAKTVSAALREDFGGQASAIKQIAQITGAKMPTVTNWYQGKNVPGARYLLRLARASPSILRFVLTQIGGELLIDAYEIFARRSATSGKALMSTDMLEPVRLDVSTNVSMEPRRQSEKAAVRRQDWFVMQLATGKTVAASDIASYWGVDVRTAWRDIWELKRHHQISFCGSRRYGSYRLVDTRKRL